LKLLSLGELQYDVEKGMTGVKLHSKTTQGRNKPIIVTKLRTKTNYSNCNWFSFVGVCGWIVYVATDYDVYSNAVY
jgi:hypothetical protein